MDKIIKKKDGTIIKEKGNYVQLYGILAQRYIPISNITSFMTTHICKHKGLSTDKEMILNFAKLYEIEWEKSEKCKNSKSLQKCINKYKTLNDFFIRKKDPSLLKIYKKHNPKYLVSPADCRTTYLYNENIAKSLWIKGSRYSIRSMLGIRDTQLITYYKNSSIIISRLAPVDYHRFHSPISGKHLGIIKIPGKYYSVDPSIVRSSINVYTTNNRIIYFIKTKYYGIVALTIIGATCVGSIVLHKMKYIKKGDEIGYFKFGGSTIIIVLPTKIKIDKSIEEHSNKNIETYLEVGEYLGFNDKAIKPPKYIKEKLLNELTYL